MSLGTRSHRRAFAAAALTVALIAVVVGVSAGPAKPVVHLIPPAATTTTVARDSVPRNPSPTTTVAPPSDSPTSAPPAVTVPPPPVKAVATTPHIIVAGVTVTMVQAKLGVAQTGTWDAATQQATLRFQTAQHIAVDGIVGPVTWGRLNPAPGAVKQVSQSLSTCDVAMSVANAHGLYLPAGWRFICPGLALSGRHVAGTGYNSGTCPCTSYAAVTELGPGPGPEGPAPYISIRVVTPHIVAYELCNVTLGTDANGNSHDRVSGGTLSPSTAQCVSAHGL